MHCSLLLTSLAFITCTVAAPAPSSNHVVHEKRQAKPIFWEKGDRVDPSIILPVRIGMTQSNLDLGPGMLDEVYVGHCFENLLLLFCAKESARIAIKA